MTAPSQVQACLGPQRSQQQAQAPSCHPRRHSARQQGPVLCRPRPSCLWCPPRGSRRVTRDHSAPCRCDNVACIASHPLVATVFVACWWHLVSAWSKPTVRVTRVHCDM